MEPSISSLRNPRVKEVLRLRNNRYRLKRGLFLIDGVREIGRAIDAQIAIDEVYLCSALCEDLPMRERLDGLRGAGARLVEVSRAVMEKLAYGERAEGFVAVARPPEWSLDGLKLPENPLVAVLEGVEKPGNLGAVLRSADAAGVSAVVTADEATDPWNPNCIRASLGTVFSMPVVQTSATEVLAWLRRDGYRIVAARVDAERDYCDADYDGPTAIVLGAEARGLSEIWHAGDVLPIRLPMSGVADSLNVSATAAVLFYEALRQRRREQAPHTSG